MAMLLPSLKLARDKARGMVCVNNLKQCGTGTILYAGDSDDCVFTNDNQNVCVQRWWPDLLMQNGYLANVAVGGGTIYGSVIPGNSIFLCPSIDPPSQGHMLSGGSYTAGVSTTGTVYGVRISLNSSQFAYYPNNLFYPGERHSNNGWIAKFSSLKTDAPWLGDSILLNRKNSSNTMCYNPSMGTLLALDVNTTYLGYYGNLYIAHKTTGNIWCPDGSALGRTGSQFSEMKRQNEGGTAPSLSIMACPPVK